MDLGRLSYTQRFGMTEGDRVVDELLQGTQLSIAFFQMRGITVSNSSGTAVWGRTSRPLDADTIPSFKGRRIDQVP